MNRSSRQNGRSSILYKECERVGTVNGSVSFGVVLNLACNPGISASFPWLSGHALLYEKYRVNKLVYRYKNLKGTASDGNIVMMFDYDTLDAAPTTAVEMTQATVWQDGAPWRIFEMAVPTDGRSLFTRSGTPAGTPDLKMYDMGRVFVAAEGCADATDHGYLEVEYEIELFGKQSSSSGGPPGLTACWNLSANQTINGVTATVAYDEEVISATNSMTNTAGTFTFVKAGNYFICAEIHADVNTFSVAAVEVDDAAQVPPVLFNIAGRSDITLTQVVSVTAGQTCRIRVTGAANCQLNADNNRISFLLMS